MVTADALARRTLELCLIKSPIGHEKELCDHLERWAHGQFPAGQVVRHSHSLVLGDFSDARPTIGLLGHLDTVPAHPQMKEPHLEGGRVHGLGSTDMKGGLSVMLALAETLPRASLPYNVVYVLYEREEGPYAESGLSLLLERCPALRGLRFAVALEPTDLRLHVGCVGSVHATLRFHGQSAHSARPWQGKNAVHQAGPFLAELSTRAPVEVNLDGYRYKEVASVTLAKGGRARNVVPELFELNLNYRFAPGKTLIQAQREVEALVAGRADIEFTDLAPSGRVCSDNPLFRRLLELTGLATEAKQAWTDVGRLSELGIDAVNLGPGETAFAHQANESASIESLEFAYRKLRAFLTDQPG